MKYRRRGVGSRGVEINLVRRYSNYGGGMDGIIERQGCVNDEESKGPWQVQIEPRVQDLRYRGSRQLVCKVTPTMQAEMKRRDRNTPPMLPNGPMGNNDC
ncbi:hypothetical protein M0804_015181 [Polistes exclamans]|nr:hypothetical protein M0804_015184 [Polistes exclamans]KAI4473775.1 hypothetical protein M0804_015181 [Polistes exclamans]